jgi:hypothetical protein
VIKHDSNDSKRAQPIDSGDVTDAALGSHKIFTLCYLRFAGFFAGFLTNFLAFPDFDFLGAAIAVRVRLLSILMGADFFTVPSSFSELST